MCTALHCLQTVVCKSIVWCVLFRIISYNNIDNVVFIQCNVYAVLTDSGLKSISIVIMFKFCSSISKMLILTGIQATPEFFYFIATKYIMYTSPSLMVITCIIMALVV